MEFELQSGFELSFLEFQKFQNTGRKEILGTDYTATEIYNRLLEIHQAIGGKVIESFIGLDERDIKGQMQSTMWKGRDSNYGDCNVSGSAFLGLGGVVVNFYTGKLVHGGRLLDSFNDGDQVVKPI